MVCASLSQTNTRPYALSMLFAIMLICVVIGAALNWLIMMMMFFVDADDDDYDDLYAYVTKPSRTRTRASFLVLGILGFFFLQVWCDFVNLTGCFWHSLFWLQAPPGKVLSHHPPDRAFRWGFRPPLWKWWGWVGCCCGWSVGNLIGSKSIAKPNGKP